MTGKTVTAMSRFTIAELSSRTHSSSVMQRPVVAAFQRHLYG